VPLPLPPVAEREGEARQRHGVEQAPHRERVTQTHKALVKDEVDREPLAKVAAMDNVAQMLVIRPVVAPDDRLPHAGIRRVSRLHQHKALAVRARGSRADSREPGLQDDALVQLVDCGVWEQKLEVGPWSAMSFSQDQIHSHVVYSSDHLPSVAMATPTRCPLHMNLRLIAERHGP